MEKNIKKLGGVGIVKALKNFKHGQKNGEDYCVCVAEFFEVNDFICLDLVAGRNKQINAKFKAFLDSCCVLGKDYSRIVNGIWKRFDHFVKIYGIDEDVESRSIINIQAIPSLKERAIDLSTKKS